MPIIDMKKVFLLGHRQEREKIFDLLHRLGTVEMLDVKSTDAWEEFQNLLHPEELPESVSQIDSKRSDIRFCLDFLQRHFPIRKNMLEQFTGKKLDLSEDQFSSYINSLEKVDEIYKTCRDAEEKLVRIRNEETQSLNLIEELQPWVSLDLPLEQIEEGNWILMGLYVIPTEQFPGLQDALAESISDFYFEEVFTDEDNAYFFFSGLLEEKQAVRDLFREKTVSSVMFPDLTGTPSQAIENLKERLEQLKEERKSVLSEVETLLEYRIMLMACFDYMDNEYEKHQAMVNLGRTENSFLLDGWVPVPVLGDLESAVDNETETAVLAIRDPEPDENVPVLLHNSGPVEPYEVVTKLFSTPKKYELDPTPFMAPFFFLFFGICLSDAGYGIILGLLSFLMLRKLKLGQSGKQLLNLLLLGSFSALVFGLMFGGVFGDLIDLPPLLFDPLEEPMVMLVGALGIGLVQIYFGMGLQAYRNMKAGEPLSALYDQGFWFILLNSLILLFLGWPPAQWLAIASAAGLVLTQGRRQRSVVLKFFSGLMSLYNLTQYLSDVLSYSRLFALGLASVVIGMVVNSVGDLVAGSIIGSIALVIILVGGHFFNMIISSLSAYVHTSRLQYLEFFNKFFEGGGRSFQPFREKNNYVDVVEIEEK
ncbi:MAG: V-type ATP synthase subunit I [Bacillota bacterium]